MKYFLIVIFLLTFSACKKEENNPVSTTLLTAEQQKLEDYKTMINANRPYYSVTVFNYSGPGATLSLYYRTQAVGFFGKFDLLETTGSFFRITDTVRKTVYNIDLTLIKNVMITKDFPTSDTSRISMTY
jgi:hypothetical protein